jgi:death-on-curing protein
VKWLTVADVLLIHQRVIQETGGEGGLLKCDSLEACVARPLASFGDQEVYPDLLSKVAALIHGIITAHPFVDGNKRVALVAADVCLRLNGFRIRPSHEVEEFFWSIARGEQTVDQIREWLAEHIELFEQGTEQE